MKRKIPPMPPFLREWKYIMDSNPDLGHAELGLMSGLIEMLIETASLDTPPTLPNDVPLLTLCVQKKFSEKETISERDVKFLVERFFEKEGDGRITYRRIHNDYLKWKRRETRREK